MHLITNATSFIVLPPLKSPKISFPITSAKQKTITKETIENILTIFLPIL